MKTLGARLYWKDAVGYHHHQKLSRVMPQLWTIKGKEMHNVWVPQPGVCAQQVVWQSKWYMVICPEGQYQVLHYSNHNSMRIKSSHRSVWMNCYIFPLELQHMG